MFVLANYKKEQLEKKKLFEQKRLFEQKKQFEQLKDRECAIYKDIIIKWEAKLFQETQTISQEWLGQWERDVLEIRNLGHISKACGQQHPMVKGICEKGHAYILSLYKKALEKKLTSEHYEKINDTVNHLMGIEVCKKNYQKTVRLMKDNGIIDEEFADPLTVDPSTKETKYKPAMLVFHWWLYVIDDKIATLKREQQEQSKSICEKRESMGVYGDSIYTNREYEEIEKTVDHSWSEEEWLLTNKKDILSLLCGISDIYGAARETFIYYYRLIGIVKAGYIAFNQNCDHSTVKSEIDACKKEDKKQEKGFSIAEGTPTFEEAYKLGAKEWMKVSSEKFYNQRIFWSKLIQIENARIKLQIIFGDEKVKRLEEAINADKEHFDTKLREALSEDKDFHYNKSCAYFVHMLS
ncbi:hypothetical protein [Bartonella taylorii]|uniref:Uncharacterized protein n=2 Tax=Bartonella taylorii TaxID=33046 RepID=A0A9Q8YXA3_BARTA|nr:hypothetical protein [Bartonella taylorii]USP02316.1 hypothetical protein LAJ60_05395 [Bartonella taylorii]